jgi:hypothetical protein
MALIATTVFQGPDTFIADCVWLDGDVSGNVNHGLGAIPQEVYYTYLASGAAAAVPVVGITVIDATKVTMVKTGVANSGAAANGRLIIKRPHSTGR